MTGIRRGFRKISELDAAGVLSTAIVEVEIGGEAYQAAANSIGGAQQFVEERPDTPSPYDDEFDASTLDAKWTQALGAGTDYEIQYSRLQGITTQQCIFRQTMALTNPLRLMTGISGNAPGAYMGTGMQLLGATKGVRFVVDGGASGNDRRIAVQRLSNLGVYEIDLNIQTIIGGYAPSAGLPGDLQLMMVIDATNIVFYVGTLGSPKQFYSYARVNVGALASVAVEEAFQSVRWFRLDRATYAQAFPVAWAG